MSLFFPSDKPVLTCLLKEAIARVSAVDDQQTFGELLVAAHKLIGRPVPSQATLEKLVQRLLPDPAAPEEKRARSKPGAQMGSDLLKWMEGMPTDRACLFVCDFDAARARRLYCEEDVDVVEAMIALKIEQQWHALRAQFEAALYGFGGTLKGGDDAPAIEVDMNDNGQVLDMISQFRQMGF